MTQEKFDQTAWLEELFPSAVDARKDNEQNRLVWAQKYLVFAGPTADPRARELLEYWSTYVRRAKVPKNASATEFAAHNALREWVEGIHAQIEFAMKGAQSLPPTPRNAT